MAKGAAAAPVASADAARPDILPAVDAQVVFTPSGRRGRFPLGTTVLAAARSLGVDIDSVCGGRGLCGRCQVRCTEGDFPKHAISSRSGHLSIAGEVEQRFSERRNAALPGCRLSCQSEIRGDLVIDVPPESQMHRQVVRKSAELRDIVLDPTIHLYYVDVRQASLDEPSGDLQRLLEALETDWQLDGLDIDPAVLHALQSSLRDGGWRVTVAVYRQSRIVAIWPGLRQEVYGVAIDIGSTTIAAQLCRLSAESIP